MKTGWEKQERERRWQKTDCVRGTKAVCERAVGASCVCVRELCVRELCVKELCVKELCGMCGQRQLCQDHREPPWQLLVLAAKALLLHYNTTRYVLIFQSKHFSTRSTTGHPIVQHIALTCSVLTCLKQF